MAMERIYVTEPRMILKAGHQGENLARCICFPLTSLAEQYGEGTWTIVFRRPFESDPYVVANQEEVGEYAVWGLDATDTAVCGEGRVELRYYVDDTLCKTDVYAVSLLPSLGTTGDAPSPYEDIIDAVAGYAAEARDAVASVPETVAELQAELDEAISGATVDSEVINARVDADGTTYGTLKQRLDTEHTELKNDISYQSFIESVIDNPSLRAKTNNAFVDNGDGTYTVGTTDYGNAVFLPSLRLPTGDYLLYGVPNGYAYLSETTSHNDAIATNDTNKAKVISIADNTKYYNLGYRIASKPSESFVIAPYLKRIVRLHDYVIKPFDVSEINWEYGHYYSDGTGGTSDKAIRSQPDLFIQVCAGSTIALKEYADGERLRFCIYTSPTEDSFKERISLGNHVGYTFSEDCYIRIYMYYSDDRVISDFSPLTSKAAINLVQYVRASESVSNDATSKLPVSWVNKIQTIQQAQGTKYTFAIQTDTHYYDGYGDDAGTNLKLFTNYIGFDFVANLGDVIRGYADETIDSPESMRTAMTEIMHRYITGISCPLFIAMGNHDTNKMWADAFGGNPFDFSEVWAREFKPAFNTNLKAVTRTGLMYYYTDFDDVRVIVLNTQDGGDGAFGIGQTQIDWLTNTALNTDKAVLVLSHVPLVNGWSVASNYVSSYANAVSAIKAFQTNGGTVIGCMSGHTHTQEYKTVDDILYVTFMNNANIAEVVMVDLENKTINTIPVGFTGAGNRSFTFA